MSKREDWLELYDEKVTAAALMAQIEQRVQQRRRDLGVVERHLPAFGAKAALPDPLPNQSQSAVLYYHLRQVNKLTTPDTTPILVASPMTRLPLIGRLWGMVRQAAHGLVLFYVNRLAAHHTVFSGHVTSTLNELTRLVQVQQQEIERLQREVERLREKEKEA